MADWLMILMMALAVYSTRALPLLLRPVTPWPPLLASALHQAPPAVLAALATPALLAPGGILEPGPRLWAGLVGALVAWRTASLPLTVAVGLAVYTLGRVVS